MVEIAFNTSLETYMEEVDVKRNLEVGVRVLTGLPQINTSP